MKHSLKGLMAALILLLSCSTGNNEALIPDLNAYMEAHEQWKELRLKRLKSEKGWLNLAGLYWLNEGSNSFGSGPGNDIRFPLKADLYCGVITLDGGKLELKLADKIEMLHQDSLVKEMSLLHDQQKGTTHLRHGDLSWYIIKRGERYGIRLRDLEHPRLHSMDSIPAYPLSEDYVVEAHLEAFDSPDTIEVGTPVEGFTERYACPGILHFEIEGEQLSLHPFNSGKGYFLVFADQTSGLDTYGAGRFMYIAPDSAGRIILDFNRAYNPPCAFSPFATCPRPPRENFLPINIEAGEKNVHIE